MQQQIGELTQTAQLLHGRGRRYATRFYQTNKTSLLPIQLGAPATKIGTQYDGNGKIYVEDNYYINHCYVYIPCVCGGPACRGRATACDRPARCVRAAMRGGLTQSYVYGRRVAVVIEQSYVEDGRVAPVRCCDGRRVRRRHRIDRGWEKTRDGREETQRDKRQAERVGAYREEVGGMRRWRKGAWRKRVWRGDSVLAEQVR